MNDYPKHSTFVYLMRDIVLDHPDWYVVVSYNEYA